MCAYTKTKERGRLLVIFCAFSGRKISNGG